MTNEKREEYAIPAGLIPEFETTLLQTEKITQQLEAGFG